MTQLELARSQQEQLAWKALGRYKFHMFGYHAANWVNFNKLCEDKLANPFTDAVHLARRKTDMGFLETEGAQLSFLA